MKFYLNLTFSHTVMLPIVITFLYVFITNTAMSHATVIIHHLNTNIIIATGANRRGSKGA